MLLAIRVPPNIAFSEHLNLIPRDQRAVKPLVGAFDVEIGSVSMIYIINYV